MITVTRLKAQVDNTNLPILLEDGTITNYYSGKYISTLASVGYTISDAERTAINNFILSGIDKGWIPYVLYFNPFLGDSASPKAGVVPLIDQVSDYDLSIYESDYNFANMFEYNSGGKISNYGKMSTPSIANAALKVKCSYVDMGGYGFTAGIKANITDSNSTLDYMCGIIRNVDNLFCAGMRKNASAASQWQRVTRYDGDTLLDSLKIDSLTAPRQQAFDEAMARGGYMTFNFLAFRDVDNTPKNVMQCVSNAESTYYSYYNGLTIPSINAAVTNGLDTTYVSSSTLGRQPQTFKLNHYGLLKVSIQKDILDQFNNDVYNLMVALGRAS